VERVHNPAKGRIWENISSWQTGQTREAAPRAEYDLVNFSEQSDKDSPQSDFVAFPPGNFDNRYTLEE
jgi:hypothetical protein